ncbi:MAG: hypothetical protein F6K50_53095 [Moorea sp. SIO3I7]|nr:hypothetical protein [Moorena sp. SIO3I7]
MTHSFLQEIKTKCDPYLTNKSCCLIIIFANANVDKQQAINEFITLTVPQTFKINQFCQWFRGHLKEHIQEARINQYLNRLQLHQGNLIRTYRVFEEIITELQRGTSIS